MSRPEDKSLAATEEFVRLLTAEQGRLSSYIRMLVFDHHEANNVLQETNLILWRKVGDFQLGTSFVAWARKIAYWQVQAHLRDKKRDRLCFSEELAQQLADTYLPQEREDELRGALRKCMQVLGNRELELLRWRYEDEVPVVDLAEKTGKTPSAIKSRLMRVRKSLFACIQQRLAAT